MENMTVMRDPLQGYDINIEAITPASSGGASQTKVLVGSFTSLMFKIVNQTETYLPVNSRIPRMLDGEIIVVWSLEQGLVNLNLIANTFGTNYASEFSKGRGQLIPRSQRFNIKFSTNMSNFDTVGMSNMDTGLNTTPPSGSGAATGLVLNKQINFCRVDTYSFGVTSGRHVVANAWQGTGQTIS